MRSHLQRLCIVVGALMTLAATACSSRPVPVVSVAPRFPDLPMPTVPTGLGAPPVVHAHEEAWRVLQTGNLDDAARRFGAVVKQAPEFFPSTVGLGLIQLVKREHSEAIEHFDDALAIDADYVPALLGRGEALLAVDRIGEAVVTLERVVALDSSRTDVQQRLGVLRFRGTQETIARAQQLERDRRWAEAKTAYQAAVAMAPDTAFLFRGLAEVEAALGERASAVEHLRKAIELDPADSPTYGRLATLLEELGNDDEALAAWTLLGERDPTAAAEARITAIRERLALARLPEQYRTIGQATTVTRGQLATLVGVRLRSVLDLIPEAGAVVVTDIRQHWAEPWIVPVTQRHVLEPFPNHTFQPEGVLTRSDLAAAVGVLLRAIGTRQTTWWQQWQVRRTNFSDLDTRHLSYPAASLAVAAEVLSPVEGRAFRPTRAVAGAEAVKAIDRLVDLATKAGLAPSGPGRP